MDSEKNVKNLLIPKSHKVWNKVEKIRQAPLTHIKRASAHLKVIFRCCLLQLVTVEEAVDSVRVGISKW